MEMGQMTRYTYTFSNTSESFSVTLSMRDRRKAISRLRRDYPKARGRFDISLRILMNDELIETFYLTPVLL